MLATAIQGAQEKTPPLFMRNGVSMGRCFIFLPFEGPAHQSGNLYDAIGLMSF
jgi:hypothetical protein